MEGGACRRVFLPAPHLNGTSPNPSKVDAYSLATHCKEGEALTDEEPRSAILQKGDTHVLRGEALQFGLAVVSHPIQSQGRGQMCQGGA